MRLFINTYQIKEGEKTQTKQQATKTFLKGQLFGQSEFMSALVIPLRMYCLFFAFNLYFYFFISLPDCFCNTTSQTEQLQRKKKDLKF